MEVEQCIRLWGKWKKFVSSWFTTYFMSTLEMNAKSFTFTRIYQVVYLIMTGLIANFATIGPKIFFNNFSSIIVKDFFAVKATVH